MEPLSGLAAQVLDAVSEAVVVFDEEGRGAYANSPAREALGIAQGEIPDAATLLPRLGGRGVRMKQLWVAGKKLGEAVFFSAGRSDGAGSLAELERDAIYATLKDTGWRLTETARRLGISRTTLWRRLNAYGLRRDRRE